MPILWLSLHNINRYYLILPRQYFNNKLVGWDFIRENQALLYLLLVLRVFHHSCSFTQSLSQLQNQPNIYLMLLCILSLRICFFHFLMNLIIKLSRYNEQFNYNEVSLLIIPHLFTTIPHTSTIPCWHLTLKTQVNGLMTTYIIKTPPKIQEKRDKAYEIYFYFSCHISFIPVNQDNMLISVF